MSNNEGNKELPTQEYLSELWKGYQDFFETEDSFRRTVALWPVCPKCGKRRSVRCPICHRLDDLFPPADADFWDGVDETPGKFHDVQIAGSSCHSDCHSCSCGHKEENDSLNPDRLEKADAAALIVNNDEVYPGLEKPRWNFENSGEKDSKRESYSYDEKSVWEVPPLSEENSPPTGNGTSRHFENASDSDWTSKTFSVSTPNYHRSQMTTVDMVPEKGPSSEEIAERFSRHGLRLVTCPTCDEPFVPKYLPHCKECGYAFEGDDPNGENAVPEEYDPYEEVSSGRVIAVTIGMIALTVFLVLFCIYFLR